MAAPITRESGAQAIIDVLHEAYSKRSASLYVCSRTAHMLEEHGLPPGFETTGQLVDNEHSARRALFVHSHMGKASANMLFDVLRQHGVKSEKAGAALDAASDCKAMIEALRSASATTPSGQHSKKVLYTKLAHAFEMNGLPPGFETAGSINANREKARDDIYWFSREYNTQEPIPVSHRMLDALFSLLDERGLTPPGRAR